MKSYYADRCRLQPAAEPVGALAVPEAAAARLLSLSPRTLWQLRRDGRGPRHVRIGGSIRSPLAELHRFLAEQQVATSTNEAGGAA